MQYRYDDMHVWWVSIRILHLLQDSEVAITAVKPTSDVSYSLKVIHRDKKSEYSVRKWRDAHLTRFESVIALKRKLKKNFSDILGDVTEDEIEMGFIEPGHGAKGKQQWLMDTDDLRDMYKTYEGKKDIMLWVYLGTKKRPRSPDPESSSKSRKTKYDVHTHKMLEVKDIADDLETRHGSGYTPEQYSVWAHMIHLRKHQSRDHPPDKPFFRGSKKQSTPRECAQSTHSSSSTSTGALPTGISPGKRIQLRSQSMQQLEMWHSLYEKGAVEEEEYKKVQDNILSDIKRF